MKREVRCVKEWTSDNIEVLKGCFDYTDWIMFLNTCSALNEQVLTIPNYITFCVGSCYSYKKKNTLYPNKKPWVTKELKSILNMKKKVFLSGTNEEKKKKINRELIKAIKIAKSNFENTIEGVFMPVNVRATWKGIKSMAAVKTLVLNQRTLMENYDSNFIVSNEFNSFLPISIHLLQLMKW